jgi:hypothetical protein
MVRKRALLSSRCQDEGFFLSTRPTFFFHLKSSSMFFVRIQTVVII